MGQKTHPIGFRLGINKPWSSNWFATKDFPEFMAEDIRVRKYIDKRLPNAGVSRVDIDRTSKNLNYNYKYRTPGIVIGKRRGRG